MRALEGRVHFTLTFSLFVSAGVLGFTLWATTRSQPITLLFFGLTAVFCVVVLPTDRIRERLAERTLFYQLKASKGAVGRLDWADARWKAISDHIAPRGGQPPRIEGHRILEDRWEIYIFTRPRTRARGAALSSVLLIPEGYRWLMNSGIPEAYSDIAFKRFMRGAEVAMYLLLAAVAFTVVCLALDLWKPRLCIMVSSLTARLLRRDEPLAAAIMAHEASHLRHKDPVRREVWNVYSREVALWLALAAGVLLIAVVQYELFSPARSEMPNKGVLPFAGLFALLALGSAFKPTWDAREMLVPAQEMRADLEASATIAHRDAWLKMLRSLKETSEVERDRIEVLANGRVPLLERRQVQHWRAWTGASLVLLGLALPLALRATPEPAPPKPAPPTLAPTRSATPAASPSAAPTVKAPTPQSLPYVHHEVQSELNGFALARLSDRQLQWIRNALLARQGRRSPDAEMQRFFEKQPWFRADRTWDSTPCGLFDPTPERLTGMDKHNFGTLQFAEWKRMGERWRRQNQKAAEQ